MIGIKYFYDVPVYRLEEKKYYLQRDNYIESTLFPKTSPFLDELKKIDRENPRENEWYRSHLANSFGGSWKYNEIIGYIRLHFLGSQIRGEYYSISNKRIVKTRKKIFEYKTWKLAPEIDIPTNPTPEQIYEVIIKYLSNCNKELKNRYIDVDLFKVIGQHVNWLGLYKMPNKNIKQTGGTPGQSI